MKPKVQRYYADRVLFDAPRRPEGALEQVKVEERSEGHVLAIPGDPVREVVFLVGGSLRLIRLTRDGREISIAFVRPKEPVVREVEYRYLVTTESSSLVASVPRELLEELCRRNKEFAERIDSVFRRRALALERRLEFVGPGAPSVRSRVAQTLEEMLEVFGDENDSVPRIPHRVLATFAGATRESVSVEMSRLAQAGVLSVSRFEILVDRARLGLVR